MKRRLTVGIFCALISQSALIYSADARPRHRTHHQRVVAAPAPECFLFFCDEPQERAKRPTKRSKRSVAVSRPAITTPVYGAPSIVEKARQYIGSGPRFGRAHLWCARFVNFVLQRTGHHGTGSDMARSFAKLPRTSKRVGAIAVMHRRGGGHVGVVSGFTKTGDPIVISGNHNNRVAEAVYPASRVYAYVSPN
jgi:uncharacterized protein (TIGR02594 family)